jgi:GTPase SAR1 family protein
MTKMTKNIDNLLSPRSGYRINIIGDYKCGKTTIFKNGDGMELNHSPSVSPTVDCRNYTNKDASFFFIITDTPGHSSFDNMNEFFYVNYDGLMIVVDLSNEKHFLRLPLLIDKIKDVNPDYNSPDKTIIIVGNDRGRQIVSDEQIENFAKQHAFFYFKFNISDTCFLNKIYELIIENKKNGKPKFRPPCFYKMINCFQNNKPKLFE